MQMPPPEIIEPLTPQEAGAMLKKARNALGLTQGQVIESVGIPNQSYLSALENGRYSIANSEYFPALARLLRLTTEQVQAISPHAVITVAAPSDPDQSAQDFAGLGAEPFAIDEALAEAVKLYGDMPEFAGIKSHNLQHALNDIDFRRRPTTPADWLAKYLKFKDDLPNGDN